MGRDIGISARSFCLAVAFFLFAFVGSCGGSGSSATLSSIAVTPASPSIVVPADEQFTATGTYSDGSTADITASVAWSSSDTAVATVVSTSGLATAVAAGTATITASDSGGTISGNTVMTVIAQDLIDVHAHASVSSSSASAEGLVNLMTSEGVSKVIMMETPRPKYQASDTSSEDIITFFTNYSGSFRYMYGGSELQPFLYATGYSGTLPITDTDVYPNGGSTLSQGDVNRLNAIAQSPSSYEAEFQSRATTAAQSGKYVGFGELAPLHYSLRSGHPYMTYKVDTPWMLWLCDLAAEYNMVMDVHFEATETTLADFATLLSSESNTKIIWDHAGWSNLTTSVATAEVFSQLLADHSNLYLSLKMRQSQEGEDTYPVDSDGNIKSEWRTLLTTYADRIMVGTDAKYWSDSTTTVETDFDDSYSVLNAMLEQLPSETAVQIRNGTAKTLFGLTQ